MAGTTSKRVFAIRFEREALAGYIDPVTFLRPEGIELISPAGTVSVLPYPDVKVICFVKDFDSFSGWKENRLFAARPKSEGLWVRFRFRDADVIDGVLPHNLLAWEAEGYTIAPPDPSFQSQRVFIPRTAITEARVLGVVGTPIRQRRAKPGQLEMFDR